VVGITTWSRSRWRLQPRLFLSGVQASIRFFHTSLSLPSLHSRFTIAPSRRGEEDGAVLTLRELHRAALHNNNATCNMQHALCTSPAMLACQGINRDVKRRSPLAKILSRALCQARGLQHAETPPGQPLQPSPLSALRPSLPTHTHSRLTSEHWCLRTPLRIREVSSSIYTPSLSSKWIDFCSFFHLPQTHVVAMLEAVY